MDRNSHSQYCNWGECVQGETPTSWTGMNCQPILHVCIKLSNHKLTVQINITIMSNFQIFPPSADLQAVMALSLCIFSWPIGYAWSIWECLKSFRTRWCVSHTRFHIPTRRTKMVMWNCPWENVWNVLRWNLPGANPALLPFLLPIERRTISLGQVLISRSLQGGLNVIYNHSKN